MAENETAISTAIALASSGSFGQQRAFLPLPSRRRCASTRLRSLGSFVSRFARSVGVSPGALRASAARDDGAPAVRGAEARVVPAWDSRSICGIVGGDVPADAGVWIGAFARGIPEGPPLAGTLVDGAGPFRIDTPSPGTYHVLVLGMRRASVKGARSCVGRPAPIGSYRSRSPYRV